MPSRRPKLTAVRVREKYAQAGRAAHTKLELDRRAVEDGLLIPD